MLLSFVSWSVGPDHLGPLQTEKAEEGTARAVVSRHEEVALPRAAAGPEDRAADRPDVSGRRAHDTLRVLYVFVASAAWARARDFDFGHFPSAALLE